MPPSRSYSATRSTPTRRGCWRRSRAPAKHWHQCLDACLICSRRAAYSIYTVTLRGYLLRGGSQSPLGALTWASLIGTLLLLPPMLAEQPWEHAWTMDEWAFLAYLGVLSTVVCYAFYAMGVADIGAPRAASFINLVPIFGIATAVMWPALNEQFGLVHVASFALVFVGVRL
ncbi:MAG: DMT family transporter, partial [Candidatus Poseidoniia archaeon]